MSRLDDIEARDGQWLSPHDIAWLLAEVSRLTAAQQRVRDWANELRRHVGGHDFEVGTDVLAALDGEGDRA